MIDLTWFWTTYGLIWLMWICFCVFVGHRRIKILKEYDYDH